LVVVELEIAVPLVQALVVLLRVLLPQVKVFLVVE
jgi:hypothetical protein